MKGYVWRSFVERLLILQWPGASLNNVLLFILIVLLFAGFIRRRPCCHLLELWGGISTSYLLCSQHLMCYVNILICRIQYHTHCFFSSLSLRLVFNCSRSMLSRFRNGAGSSAVAAIPLNHSKSRCLINMVFGGAKWRKAQKPFTSYQIYDCYLTIYLLFFRNMNILRRQTRVVTLVAVRNTLASICTIPLVWIHCWLCMFSWIWWTWWPIDLYSFRYMFMYIFLL